MATILIVDDEPYLISVLEDQLKKMRGHNIIGANTGRKAIDLAKKKLPNLILLDMGLPDIDGLQVAGALKSDARTMNIPILMCTADDNVSDIDASFKAGVAGYIVKPFSLQKIRDKIDEILGYKPAVQEDNKGQE